jgi:hypothetical protein
MDPDANLKEQLEVAAAIQEARDEYDRDSATWGSGDDKEWNEQQAERAMRLAELVEALNEWILKGGFLPKAWHDVQIAKVLT